MLRKVIVEANPKQYIRQIVLNKRKLEDYIIYQMQKLLITPRAYLLQVTNLGTEDLKDCVKNKDKRNPQQR